MAAADPRAHEVLAGTHELGAYAPAERRGPVIWLKCVVEGTLPDATPEQGTTPVIYLPEVGLRTLRATDDCDVALQPLVKLQYRGAVWRQRNGRDWTVEAFLASDDAPYGIVTVGWGSALGMSGRRDASVVHGDRQSAFPDCTVRSRSAVILSGKLFAFRLT